MGARELRADRVYYSDEPLTGKVIITCRQGELQVRSLPELLVARGRKAEGGRVAGAERFACSRGPCDLT